MDILLSVSNSFHDTLLKNAPIILPKSVILIVVRLNMVFVYSQNIPSYVHFHCIKGVCIRSFSGVYFPAFGINTEIYLLNLCIHSECGKIQTRKSSNTGILAQC